MKTLISRFVKDEAGATAIEYGLIAAGISIAFIRPRARSWYSSVGDAVSQSAAVWLEDRCCGFYNLFRICNYQR